MERTIASQRRRIAVHRLRSGSCEWLRHQQHGRSGSRLASHSRSRSHCRPRRTTTQPSRPQPHRRHQPHRRPPRRPGRTTADSTVTAPTTTTAPSTTAVVDVGIAWTTIDIVDPTRPTDEVRGPDGTVLLAAAPNRTIPTVLLYPGRGGGGENATVARVDSRPLVVWLNGLGGRATAEDPLLLALYGAGYVVADPNIAEIAAPVSHAGGYVHQPGDVSAVIDALTTSDDAVVDDLAAIVDADRIGVAGHSIGGSGVYGVAFHQCCRDDRISAAAAFAPPCIDFEGGEFQFEGMPLLIIHGSADQLIAVEQSEAVREPGGGGAARGPGRGGPLPTRVRVRPSRRTGSQ